MSYHPAAFWNSASRSTSLLGGLLVATLLSLVLVGCDGSALTGASSSSEVAPVSVSFAVGSSSASKAASTSKTFTDAEGNALRLDEVEVVLREVEFDRADGAENCSSENDSEGEEECEEVESGPLLVSLPLASDAPTVVIDTTLPVGSWDGVEFDVHPLHPHLSSDSTVLAENNFPPNVSVRATGTYTPAGNAAQDFTFTSDLNAEREIEFEPPVDVTADGTTNITFSVGLTKWFRQQDSTLVNPSEAGDGGTFEELVEDNIESSIEGFEDDDRDGEEDGDEDDGDDEEEDGDEDEEGDDGGDEDDDGDDDEEEDDGDEEDDEAEIETTLNNTGPDPDASGEAEYEQETDRTEFKVEVEDLDPGTYELVVADTARGELDVGEGDDGTEGEIEFRDPAEPGHPLLDFDPRGEHVAVEQDGTVYLEVDFPSSP